MKAKNGISLIVLVITIVVVIILAAAVILSLGDSNPINDARAANLANSQDNISSAIVNLVGNRLAKYATSSSSTYELLAKTESMKDVTEISAVIGTDAFHGTAFNDVGATPRTEIKDLHKITGWPDLNLKDPGDDWYYSVETGKVYVFYQKSTTETTVGTKPSWSNNTTNAIILDSLLTGKETVVTP